MALNLMTHPALNRNAMQSAPDSTLQPGAGRRDGRKIPPTGRMDVSRYAGVLSPEQLSQLDLIMHRHKARLREELDSSPAARHWWHLRVQLKYCRRQWSPKFNVDNGSLSRSRMAGRRLPPSQTLWTSSHSRWPLRQLRQLVLASFPRQCRGGCQSSCCCNMHMLHVHAHAHAHVHVMFMYVHVHVYVHSFVTHPGVSADVGIRGLCGLGACLVCKGPHEDRHGRRHTTSVRTPAWEVRPSGCVGCEH